MKRDGKDLEELVAFVEEQLVPTGFKVTTNKKTFREDGVQSAELDVEISGKLGSTEITWLIECRDRPSQGPAPTSWIEQLVGRKERFNFSKVTAVSTTGFVAEAKNYASQSGIELREVKSISVSDFRSWLGISCLKATQRLHKLDHVKVLIDPVDDPVLYEKVSHFIKSLKSDDKFLRSSSTGALSSAGEAFLGATSQMPEVWSGIAPNTEGQNIRLHVKYENDADHFLFDTEEGSQRIRSIIFEGQLILREKEIPASALTYVKNESDEAIAEIARFADTFDNKKVTIELRRIPDSGNTHVVLKQELLSS